MATALLLAAAVGCGLVGGIFFAFSAFVMAALDRLPPAQAVAAMQAINVTVLNPLFFAAFFGTVGLSLLAAIVRPSPTVLAAAFAYLAGCVLVTIAGNVPLNDRLARLGSGDPAAAWRLYRGRWTAWNHLRTAASLAAAAGFALALTH
ncbi:membrane protein [Allostella humosa]|nr:membrane protein [Stella humosa]